MVSPPVPNESVPDDILSAHLEGEAVLLHMETKRYYRLNETGQRIWRLIEEGHSRADAAAALEAEYDVERATARAEIDRLIAELLSHDLVRRDEDAER